MLSPFSLELYACEVLRDRRRQAALDALVAQLPRAPLRPRRDLAVRLRLANGLRALAFRLDPCGAAEPARLLAPSR